MKFPFRYAENEQDDLFAFQQSIFVEDRQTVNNWLQQLGLTGLETFALLVKLNQTTLVPSFNIELEKRLVFSLPHKR